MAKGMDPLGEISGSDSEDDGDEETEPAPEPLPAKKKAEVDYETLKRAGYSGGPSVLGIKEQQAVGDWSWGKGTEEEDNMTAEDHVNLRHQTNAGLEEACGLALKNVEDRKRQREVDQAEREEAFQNRLKIQRDMKQALRQDKKKDDKEKSWRHKERVKREKGQQGSGRNWVEEEKRILKHAGVGGFGFD